MENQFERDCELLERLVRRTLGEISQRAASQNAAFRNGSPVQSLTELKKRNKKDPNAAGMDRLDTALTVGQMQGKFQLSVMPTAGHAIHEDEPRKVAELIATFITRHKFADANR